MAGSARTTRPAPPAPKPQRCRARAGSPPTSWGRPSNAPASAALAPGTKVNLERSVRLEDRLGGHLVQGHVDDTAAIIRRGPQEQWEVVRISLPPGLARYVVHKGSITVDGISLTVSATADDWFEVSLIPETLKRTTLGVKQPGDAGQPGGRRDREVRGEADRRRQVTAQADEMTELNGTVPLDDVTRAIADIAAGRPVVVVDDADRENEGDLVFAASAATPELLAFTIRHARGLICVPMLGADLDRLHLPQMTSQNQEHHGTAFTRQRGRAQRHQHRHLRGRPRQDHTAARQPVDWPR